MVNRAISKDMKELALRLVELGWTDIDICETLSVLHASLYHWKALVETLGDVVRPPSPLLGRTCLVTRAVMSEIEVLLRAHPATYLNELAWWLGVHHNIVILRSTLKETLD